LIIHTDPQKRGDDIFDDKPPPPFSGKHSDRIFQAIDEAIASQEPRIVSTGSFLVVCHPLSARNPIMGNYSFAEYGAPPWMIISTIPMPAIMSPINLWIRLSILFIIAAALATGFIIFYSSKKLIRRVGTLQRELGQSKTMQDNLKYGLFMMDHKFIIRGIYSKAIEKIFSVSNLVGRNLLDILSLSLRPGELEGIEDYIGMVFKRTFDEDMLASINPVDEFDYESIETGEKKSLRSNFVLADHDKGPAYIVVTMEDITAEKELEKQLKEAEVQKEKEMRAIFQVIQLSPKVLRDFIEDAEFEFERINDMLKSKIVHQEAMVQMFQFVHAMKSNALILNLEAFATALHGMESTIKDLQEEFKREIPFDALLGLVIQLNETMKEKDLLKSSISKIDAFKKISVEEDLQERYLLVETLSQLCRKVQQTVDKRVKFTVLGIDNEVLDYGPRKILKEIITQLIRNAVYHGIETPGEREAAGKSPEGEIQLSLKYNDNQIIIKLNDDGKGIDFDRVRKKAEAKNLISDPKMADDKDFLIKTIFTPGFSTREYADFHAGRGIGLSLVRDRTKELGGNISVASVKGKSTTFTIDIPLEVPEAAPAPV
jgi:two-component system chemotaxis sensor kinase CheA